MEKQKENNGLLNGQKVIVMGGSSGIGLATARAAAAEGAKVIILSSNQQRVNEALASIPGGKGFAVDLSKEENIKAFFAGIGNFDHLIYTAGENISFGLVSDLDLEDARQYFNLRYWGAVASVKYGSPYINAGGSITLMSGNASTRPGKGWSMGSSICGAMESFTRTMAVELGPIRVNAVAPGVTKTNLWNSMPEADREALYKNVADTIPAKRVGEAEDIAQTFVYLMKQRFGTGQVLIVDGGSVLV